MQAAPALAPFPGVFQEPPFPAQNEMRVRAEAKTPDALLPVPLFVRGRQVRHAPLRSTSPPLARSALLHVQVHWIDSKATFGDPASHAEYVTSQFASYVNRCAPRRPQLAPCHDHSQDLAVSHPPRRYASGLVIYWFGFDASIDTDADLVLSDGFPHGDCELMSRCALRHVVA